MKTTYLRYGDARGGDKLLNKVIIFVFFVQVTSLYSNKLLFVTYSLSFTTHSNSVNSLVCNNTCDTRLQY